MRYFIQLDKKRELWILSLIYLLSHGFLIIISGRWWDDWCMVDQSYQALRNFAMEMGRPSVIIIMSFAKWLPEPGYRIITFLLFYWCGLFLYRILKEWLSLSDVACFWICALYSVIPANDARIMLAIFPYSISLFFFMAGMCYLAIVLNKGRSLAWKDRLVCYLFFIISFTTNSTLVFYGLILLMILTKEVKRCKIKGLWKYVDFVILPIAFFVTKNKLFPTYGAYADYNSITIEKLLEGIKDIIPVDLKILKTVFINFLSIGDKKLLCIILFLALVFVVLNYKNIWKIMIDLFCSKSEFETDASGTESLAKSIKENVLIVAVGILALSLGLFAYVVVRGVGSICLNGANGRDSALVAFGVSMVIYGMYSLIFRDKIITYLMVGTILGGGIFFNMWYASYQTDYYRQLGFQYQLTQHEELMDACNIIYLNDDSGLVNIQSFYALNGNSELALGIDDKFIMSGFSGTSFMEQNELLDYFVESGNYHMDSYDISNKRIDAVIDYSFSASYFETMKLKALEIFDYSRFLDKLHRNTDMVVYMYGTEEFNHILLNNGYENIK